MRLYDPSDWYWIIGGDESRAWSSAAGAYVDEWPADAVTRIASADDLADVLRPYGLRGPVSGPEDVNRERQRRIVAGKVIGGVHVTGRDEDARNLTNLALAAQLRMASGDTTTTTVFRDGQNIDHELTPPQMLALWQQSAAYVSALYAASWAIKAMEPLPADVTDDDLWPARG